MKKTLAVFTGSRADYGLLRPLLSVLKERRKFSLKLIVGGAHFSRVFGATHREIRRDGFRIDARVRSLAGEDSEAAVAASIGRGVTGCAAALERLSPAFLLLLGDRFETFSCAAAAGALRIPIIHLHGGELTIGSPDEAWRHAITKLSHLHFTATQAYRRRVIQMGEDPRRVYNVGALGIDNIRTIKRLSRPELERELGFSFGKMNLLVTIHSVARETPFSLRKVLAALSSFPAAKIIFTGSNADAGSREFLARIKRFTAGRPGRTAYFASLGTNKYLSVVACVDAVVGNSSSGIIEAPSLGIPTVNIGDRQEKRVRAASVIDCSDDTSAVRRAIRKALSPAFQRASARVVNPYGDGRTALRIARLLEKELKKIKTPKKSFYDLAFPFRRGTQ